MSRAPAELDLPPPDDLRCFLDFPFLSFGSKTSPQ